MAWLRSHPKPLVRGLGLGLLTAAAFAGIGAFESSYDGLQTAPNLTMFRQLLTSPPRAMGAACCDLVFAAGYGMLGVVIFRGIGGRTRVATIGAITIGVAALLDELENALLIQNIARQRTTTDGWIDAMTWAGTFKWWGVRLALCLLVVAIALAVRRKLRRK
ncbi:MAG: hypothetical protein QOH79_3094 [Acidimicrobiaceae bacterium]